MKCFCCGLETRREGAPEPKECGGDSAEDCSWAGAVETIIEVVEGDGKPCRCVVVCNPCFHRIHPDMWINRKIWEELKPTVPYDRLPVYDHDAENRDDPMTYKEAGEV